MSRGILSSQPGLANSLGPDDWEFAKLIPFYTFTLIFEESLSLSSFVSLNCVNWCIFLAQYRSCVCFFFFLFVHLSTLMRKSAVRSTDLSRFTSYPLLHCVWCIFLGRVLEYVVWVQYHNVLHCKYVMQPSTDQLKLHGCTLLVTCLLIAIKSSEMRTGSYFWGGGDLRPQEFHFGIYKFTRKEIIEFLLEPVLSTVDQVPK